MNTTNINNTLDNKTLDSVRKHEISTIGGLVDIAKESAEFYGREAESVADPNLKNLLVEMSESRRRFVDDATRNVEAGVLDASRDRPVVDEWKMLYGELKTRMSDKSLSFIPTLRGAEDRLLVAFDKASVDTKLPTGIKQAVVSYLPSMRKYQKVIHDHAWAKAA